MKIASDLMTKDPIIVNSAMTLHDAIELFVERTISSAPVIDGFGEIKGMLTELSLIKSYFRYHIKSGSKEQVAHHLDLLEPAAVVFVDDNINDTIKLLITSTTHRVVVLNRLKKIVGIISPKDVLKTFSGDRDKESKLERELNQAQDQLRQTISRLNDEKAIVDRYHEYIDNAPFLIHSVNEEGKIILANKVLTEALGYKPGELVGKTFSDIFEGDNHEKALKGLEKIIKEGSHPPVITAMKRKDGTPLRVETVSSCLKDKNGKFFATITMSRKLGGDNMLRALHGVLDMNNPIED